MSTRATRPVRGLPAWLCVAVLAVAALGCRRSRFPEDARCLAATPPAARARPAGDFAFSGWTPPRHAEIRLLELPGEVAGSSVAATGPLASFEGEDVSRFVREPLPAGGVRLRGPDFDPPLRGVARLRLRLRPGGATHVRVVPFGASMDDDAMQRSHRGVDLALERDAAPDAPVELVVDVSQALRGNWTDAAGDPGLTRIEIELPGATAEGPALEQAVVEGEGVRFAAAPAGHGEVDREGIVRPSWYVNAGARVAVRLRLPPGAPELRWHEAATAGARSVRVLDGARADVLSRGAGASGWEPRRASLASHAGHEVVIELAAEGEGTAFFGEPRVVASGPETSTPDVLVYLIDTLRADALGAYGSPRAGVSPTIDALARGGVVFSQALSTSSWTKPAIPTLLTGLHPMTHRVGATSYTDRLPEGVPLLQEAFRTAGWRTGSFSASPLGSTLSGLERGFAAAYTPQRWQGEIGDLEHPGAEQLHAALLAWVDEEPELPFFAYVQTLEVHEWKRARYARDLAPGFEPYDAAVHDADRRLGELLEALRSRGRHPLVVVLADHGESFGEHGVHGHGTSLFQSQIHIPLVLYAEGALPAMTVTDPVALTDVAPTVLDLAGLPPLPGQDGASLTAFPRGEGAAPRGVSSELVRFVWRPDAPPWRSMVSPELGKLIRVKGLPDLAYDLAHDRCETRPRPALAGTLAAALDERLREEDAAHERFAAQHGATTKGAVDAAEVERLRALGYVQ